jgi:hypothetical protein
MTDQPYAVDRRVAENILPTHSFHQALHSHRIPAYLSDRPRDQVGIVVWCVRMHGLLRRCVFRRHVPMQARRSSLEPDDQGYMFELCGHAVGHRYIQYIIRLLHFGAAIAANSQDEHAFGPAPQSCCNLRSRPFVSRTVAKACRHI